MAQNFYMPHQNEIAHERTADLKWWEIYISSEVAYTIQVDSVSDYFKVFLANEGDTFNALQRQQSIQHKMGWHHVYIFNQFEESDKQGYCRLLISSALKTDTLVLTATQGKARVVFPQKGSGLFKINMGDKRNAEVLVYDTLRSIVHQTDWSGRLLDLRGLTPGLYTLQILEEEYPIEITDGKNEVLFEVDYSK